AHPLAYSDKHGSAALVRLVVLAGDAHDLTRRAAGGQVLTGTEVLVALVERDGFKPGRVADRLRDDLDREVLRARGLERLAPQRALIVEHQVLTDAVDRAVAVEVSVVEQPGVDRVGAGAIGDRELARLRGVGDVAVADHFTRARDRGHVDTVTGRVVD